VAGPGDPYLVAWIMWWDYHATFTDPLNLFHANVFFPYRYTLAFSEHCYGLSLPFFPLFFLGFRPLTVHAIAMFLGFALSGYGAFRLARTLTGSYGVAWVAGILFAFVPYRFNLMAQLVYLFSMWIPLLFEALLLFARKRSWKRAAWLGFVFFMTGLTSISWFLLSLIPLAIWTAVLLTHHGLWRDRELWRRGAVALGAASVGLAPFMVPYYIVSKVYGFKRRIDDVQAHSAMPMHWFVAEGRSKLWAGMGEKIPEAWKFQMFPGLLMLLLPLAELFLIGVPKINNRTPDATSRVRWIKVLDGISVVAFALSVLAVGYDGSAAFHHLFRLITSERALTLLAIVILTRLCLSYPNVLRRSENANLVEMIRSARRSDAFWLGVLLAVIGFLYSIGWNFFFYRILYDLVPGFRSMRAPMRGAVFAYLGLALLAGLGTKRIAELIKQRRKLIGAAVVYTVVCTLLLVELNAAPLYFIRGDVFPDAVTLRLKQTPMRGGIAYLPADPEFNQRYMLRAADHGKPLIVATSGFDPPYVVQIEQMTHAGAIPEQLMDLLEKIPASYLVIENQFIVPDRRADYVAFLVRAVASGRLRFVNRFDGTNDLYAVMKTEPAAKSEAALPPELKIRSWASLIEIDPANLLINRELSQTLYRVHLATFGHVPRYEDFMRDVMTIGRNVVLGFGEQGSQSESSIGTLVEEWQRRPDIQQLYGQLNNADYVDRLLANSGVDLDPAERAELIGGLVSAQETRPSVLLRIVHDKRFVEKEGYRSLVVLHYFGYFGRNPDDPPDHNLDGLDFWIRDLERNHNPEKLSAAFADSIEYKEIKSRR